MVLIRFIIYYVYDYGLSKVCTGAGVNNNYDIIYSYSRL